MISKHIIINSFLVNTNSQTKDVSKTIEVQPTETEGDRDGCLGDGLNY
jgi:hypothetical protein